MTEFARMLAEIGERAATDAEFGVTMAAGAAEALRAIVADSEVSAMLAALLRNHYHIVYRDAVALQKQNGVRLPGPA